MGHKRHAITPERAVPTQSGSAAQTPLRPRRIDSIDVLRAIALTGMVLCHFTVYYSSPVGAGAWIHFVMNHTLGDLGAGTFLALMGISQVLSAEQERSAGGTNLTRKALIRAGYIVVVGLIMIAVVWGPRELWQWDILTLMGTATLVLFAVRRWNSLWVIALIVLIIAATPSLRAGLDFARVWGAELAPVQPFSAYVPGLYYDPPGDPKIFWTLRDIVQGYLFVGEFPVMPWLAFPLVGLVIGRRVVSRRMIADTPAITALGAALFVTGFSIAFAARGEPASAAIRGYLAPLSFYPDSFTMTLVQMGFVLWLFPLVYRGMDRSDRPAREPGAWIRYCRRLSRYSLTVYFMHYVLLAWPLWIGYLASGEFLIQKAMSPLPAFACGVFALMVLHRLMLWLDRKQGIFSLEWCLAMLVLRFAREPTGMPN
jgi:uncharacterized membrane protein